MATKAAKSAKTVKAVKPAKAKAKATAAKPAKKPAPGVKVPAFFVAPDWGNVLPPPVEIAPTGDPSIDDALRAVCSGEYDALASELAARAPTSALIATYRGPALQPVEIYWNDDVVATLSPGDKRKHKQVYWAAESAKNLRDRLFLWFSTELAKTPEGRTYLVELAGSDIAPRVREMAAGALRKAKPDRDLLRAIAEALDPLRWAGDVKNATSTWLDHTYALGVMAAIALDPDEAARRFVPLLVASRELHARVVTSAVCNGVILAIDEAGVDPASCRAFTPALCGLLAHAELKYRAITALQRLPADPAIAEAAQRSLGASPQKVVYWHREAVELIASSSDPKYLPWLAAALADSWMNWPPVFRGLGNIGDPLGTALIEHWLESNAASDRTEAAAPILASLRERGGEPTAEHRATAAQLLGPAKKKRR